MKVSPPWKLVLCELARNEAPEATVAGMSSAQALAWSCWKTQDRWPSEQTSNREMTSVPGFGTYLTRSIYSVSVNAFHNLG